MGQETFKRMLREAIARKGISHRELGRLTDPSDPELGRRRVQRHLHGTEPTAASRIAYAKALDAPELAPDCVEGHRSTGVDARASSPAFPAAQGAPACTTGAPAPSDEHDEWCWVACPHVEPYDPVGHGYALGDPKSPDAGRWA